MTEFLLRGTLQLAGRRVCFAQFDKLEVGLFKDNQMIL